MTGVGRRGWEDALEGRKKYIEWLKSRPARKLARRLTMDQFDILLDAHQVFILVDTTEVDRAQEEIASRIEDYSEKTKVPYEVLTWTFGRGWSSAERGDRDYLSAISRPVDSKWNQKVLIYRNFGFAWDEPRLFHSLVEQFHRLYDHCDENDVVCFFVGRIGKIPQEILPFFATWDFPLPTEEELVELAKEVMEREEVPLKKDLVELSALALKGLTMIEGERALGMAIASGTAKQPVNLRVLHQYKAELVKKSGLLEYVSSTEEVKDLGGMGAFKGHYAVVSSFYRRRKEAMEYGLAPPRGCCLVGIQGCGKSLSAKVLANMFKLPLYRWDVGKLFGQFVGESEERTRQVLKLIKAVSPAIVLVDEAEKMFAGHESSGHTSGGVESRVLGSVLYFMEEENDGAFFFFTCNDIEALPPELTRAGRLDDTWFVDLPNHEERKEIFSIHISKARRDPRKYDVELMADVTEGFTGADIAGTVRKAMFSAFYQERDFKTEDVLEAIRETTPFGETHKEVVEQLRAWAATRAKPVSLPPSSTTRPRRKKTRRKAK